jgi:predicted RNA polymerase sigma factor
MIILLKDQDRRQWNYFMIEKGNEYIDQSAKGEMVHDFHIEAAIASVHANARTYEQTNWKLILNLYTLLWNRTRNPMVTLNRSLALGEVEGYDMAIAELVKMKGFSENCYYNTTLAELYLRSGNKVKAKEHLGKALSLTSSNAEIELIRRKLAEC